MSIMFSPQPSLTVWRERKMVKVRHQVFILGKARNICVHLPVDVLQIVVSLEDHEGVLQELHWVRGT